MHAEHCTFAPFTLLHVTVPVQVAASQGVSQATPKNPGRHSSHEMAAPVVWLHTGPRAHVVVEQGWSHSVP